MTGQTLQSFVITASTTAVITSHYIIYHSVQMMVIITAITAEKYFNIMT